MAKPTQFQKHPQTDADVRLLMLRFPDVVWDGRVITHADIETVLRVSRHDSYYHTVTKHWRRALFEEQRLYLDGRSARGEGFKVLTPDEMVRFGHRRVRDMGRALKKAAAVIAAPEDDAILDSNLRSWRARVLLVAEQLLTTHGHVIRKLGAPIAAPKQLARAPLAP